MTSKASIDALRSNVKAESTPQTTSASPAAVPASEVEAVAAFVADLQAAHGQTAVATKPPRGMTTPAITPPSTALVPEAKESYSHEAMVRLMVANPSFTHAQLAGHFGRPAVWMSAVLASEAFQQVLDLQRHLVADPALTASLDERFRAVAIRSVTVLGERLNNPAVADLVVLKAAEIAVKALGVGILPAPVVVEAPKQELSVAEKLLAAMDKMDEQRTLKSSMRDVTDAANVSEVPTGPAV